MAETSYLWDNPGTGDSPALGYGNSLLNQVIFRMLLNGTGNQGVLEGRLNELEVTDGGGLNAAVDTGAAICYGVWFESDAATNVAIANNATEWVVVRASWATQTARLTAIAPGAFTQNPGVTYDIPLAQVTTVAGSITLITDTRDYCEYSTKIWPLGVTTEHIQTDAVTIAKLIDQDRWLDIPWGALQPDTVSTLTATYVNWDNPLRTVWDFVDAATRRGWITFLVPDDISSANITVHVRLTTRTSTSLDTYWCYSAWVAAASGVLANAAACTTITHGYVLVGTEGTYDRWEYNRGYDIGSFAVSAGDIVHMSIERQGAHANDTYNNSVYLLHIRMEYTGDS